MGRYRAGMGTVDDFLAELPDGRRRAFEQVIALAEAAAPGAEQGTSYGMAALLWRGRPLLGFASAKGHLSLFPFSPGVIDEVRPRLEGYSLSKGTIRFDEGHPLPDDVVTDIVAARRAEIDAKLGTP